MDPCEKMREVVFFFLILGISAAQSESGARVERSIDVQKTCTPYANPASSYCQISYKKTYRGKKGGRWWKRTKYFTKYKLAYKTDCCDGYGGSSCKPKCHGQPYVSACNIYNHGRVIHKDGDVITCSGGACTAPNRCTSCNTGYYPDNSDGYCKACQPIPHCNIPYCTNSLGSVCKWCDGEVFYDRPGYYAYTNHRHPAICEEACSWRQGKRCYPGTCNDDMIFSSCDCADDFYGQDCASFSSTGEDRMHLHGPSLELTNPNDAHGTTLIVPDIDHPDQMKWTNELHWTNLNFDITGTFDAPKAPIESEQEKFSYIEFRKTHIGVKDMSVTGTFFRGNLSSSKTWHKDCEFEPSCDGSMKSVAISSLAWSNILSVGSFAHLDRIILEVSMTNGGIVTYKNREKSDQEESYSINGITKTRTIALGFDTEAPVHCKEFSNCTSQPLVTPEFTTEMSFDVQMEGWADLDSGLHQYHFDLYQSHIKDKESSLLEQIHALAFVAITDHLNGIETQVATINVSEPGVYLLELSVFDWAGNHKLARRIFMFDDQSEVTLINEPTFVRTAEKETQYEWINMLSDSVEVVWTNRFINERHDTHGWLNAVKQPEYIDRELDDNTEVSERNISSIHNIQGIVEFRVGYDVDMGFGSEVIHNDFIKVSRMYFDEQRYLIDEEFVDGKQLRVKVRGYDVMGEYVEDNTTVTVDSSPPVIRNLWLTKGDVLNMSVHNLEELNQMTFEWEVFDIHSGLNNVSWRIFDNFTNEDIVHGYSLETPQGNTPTMDECVSRYQLKPRGHNCYCTPFSGCFHQHYQVKPQITTAEEGGIHSHLNKGSHESEYFIEVTATNIALLTTVKTKKITIDTSPPYPGHVLDGIPDLPEIDFQQSMTLSAHWNGFIDKESGVWFYKYAFGNSCLPRSAFDLNSEYELLETYLTTASTHVTDPGKYFLTVAAYNHALDPSDPICSDGITVDNTEAYVTELVVTGAVTRSGLLKNSVGEVWMLEDNRERFEIVNPSQICLERATLLSDAKISEYPMKRLLNGSKEIKEWSTVYNDIAGVTSPPTSFLKNDAYLDISWNVSDVASGIHDFEVGLSSQGLVQDIEVFRSSRQHRHLRLTHPNLWNLENFYVLVKAITKASVESVKAFGPFSVDTTPPLFQGEINLGLERTNDTQFLVARWSPDSFIDHGDPTLLLYQYAIGTVQFGFDVMPFHQLTPGANCVEHVSCTAIDVDSLPWSLHGHQSYYATVKATNIIGLSVLACSDKYVHNVELASSGLVYDVDNIQNSMFRDIEDIDFQEEVDTLSVSWSGFEHPHVEIKYHVCIQDATSDPYVLCEGPPESTRHTFTGLSLEPFTTYHQVVIAETFAGNVTVRSDGVTVVQENYGFHIEVKDGEPCKPLDDSFSGNTSHHFEDKRLFCQPDIDFQSSLNQLGAYWNVPSHIAEYVPDMYWAIDMELPVTRKWITVRDFEHIKTVNQVKAADLELEPGIKYRISLKPCATIYCYTTLHSNGVFIIPNPPIFGSIAASYDRKTNEVMVNFDPFHDPDIEDTDDANDVMDHYEWAFTDASHNGRLVTKWRRADVSYFDDKLMFLIPLEKNISLTKCWKVSVRGYTKAGLSSVVSEELLNCSNVQEVRPGVVIDAAGDYLITASDSHNLHKGQPINLGENQLWEKADIDYTSYNNIISATWPTLRYNKYEWAVLQIQSLDTTTFYKDNDLNLRDPCSHPDAIQCGETENEFMNAFFDDGQLLHGKRYIICIHANATSIEFEKWTLNLDDVSVCSDGVTVDLTPPTPSPVWIGNNMDVRYQVSASDLSVNWQSFIDVEEAGFTVHASGVSRYQVAIGSSHGGVDIVDFVDVGLSNHHTFHDLNLQSGHSYFATVKAYDFTSQSSAQVSRAVKVDSSPPTLTDASITLDENYITDTAGVSACWNGVFEDKESGMAYYNWSIGTFHGYNDVMAYKQTFDDCDETDSNHPLEMKDGHSYFVSVKGVNNAGLSTLAVSWAFVVDTTAPVKGFVYDGLRGTNGSLRDIDYSTSTSTLDAHWTNFFESHGSIKEYSISVGSCPGCDDILQNENIGITNEIHLEKLNFAEGITSYVTVTACNTADLCTSASSDGILIDKSPPVKGFIYDGIEGDDKEYQASRLSIGAKWFDFVDSQSDISNYVWRVGTTPGGDDLVPPTNLHMSEEGYMINIEEAFGYSLPVGVRIFNTVRAYNKAGMYTEVSSNGFIIDDTPPTFSKELTHVNIGSVVPQTSVVKSFLRMSWNVSDQESSIDEQYLSLSSHIGGDFNLSSIKIPGVVRDYTFTDISLHDGSRYDVTLISCNRARKCVNSTVENIFVDSSHPTPGLFAINTDHAAALQREPDGWMTWTMLSINLAWLGFEDYHSGIDKYYINIGSTFMGDDLNKRKGPVEVEHKDNGSLVDEGMVQVEQISTESLAKIRSVFISMWAVNKVGLSSPVVHAEFELAFGGEMVMRRRCSALTCHGHCVCSPHGELCHHDASYCNDITLSNVNSLLEISDYIKLTFPENASRLQITPLLTLLAAKWQITKAQGSSPIWYEWSVGLTSEDSPIGIFDVANDRVWHDAGRSTSWIASLPAGKHLANGYQYSFFVRAWYDANTYAIFKSPGVLVYSTPPKSVVIQGRAVKELKQGQDTDIDFVDSTMPLSINWKGKFANTHNSLHKYHLYLSTYPGGHDTHVLGETISIGTTSFNISGLQLREGVKYFSVVQAYNLAGLHSTVWSDGFMIDNHPPTAGVVNDGEVYTDLHAINNSELIPSFWYDFVDRESGIKSYSVCLSSKLNLGQCDILQMKNVGVQTKVKLTPAFNLQNGAILVSEVRAFDFTGHTSETVTSSGVILDTTPPVRAKDFIYSKNIVKNPSFESNNTTVLISTIKNVSASFCTAVNSWDIPESSCAIIVSRDYQEVIPDEDKFLIVAGTVKQYLEDLSEIGHYRLTFYTAHVQLTDSHLSTGEGKVRVGDNEYTFILYNKPSTRLVKNNAFGWQKHTFHMNILESNVAIEISAVGRTTHFALDNVILEHGVLSDERHEDISGHVNAHTVFIHDWSSVHAEWHFLDEETGIIQHMWAIGTVKGGTQLQPFKSVGKRTFAINNSLHLVHNSVAYVTVLAINGAGLATLSYSDVLYIDLTAPQALWMSDGLNKAEDIDYQNEMDISANWFVEDPESGIKSCSYAIGTGKDDETLEKFTHIDMDSRNISVRVTAEDVYGETVYVTLKCTNGAGLSALFRTNGVRVLTHPPSTENVILEVLVTSLTQYPAIGTFHGDKTFVKFRWTGFQNDEGIDTYSIALDGEGVHLDELADGTTTGFSYASFINLNLTDGDYTVSVTAINELQMFSKKQRVDFTLLTEPPSLTGKRILASWNKAQSKLECSWHDVFSSSHPIYYELTITVIGGGDGDVIQWAETTDVMFDAVLDVEKL